MNPAAYNLSRICVHAFFAAADKQGSSGRPSRWLMMEGANMEY